MNKLLILVIILLASCNNGPKFQVGDCTRYAPVSEFIEMIKITYPYQKIYKVGKKSYLYKDISKSGVSSFKEDSFGFYELGTIEVECPEGFK